MLTIECSKPGIDGNAITMYAVAKNTRLMTTSSLAAFSGGSSNCIWRISLDFSALSIPSIRQMWFTFAPPIPDGSSLSYTEWEAEFTNWMLIGPRDFELAF